RMAIEDAARAMGGPVPEPAGRPTSYLERFSELWQTARNAAEACDLLTFPAWPVRYVEQPARVRDAAPYLYFLPYRPPAPFASTRAAFRSMKQPTSIGNVRA